MRSRALGLAVVAALACGCAPPIQSVASHTLRAGPDHDTDVVWVTISGELYRCTGAGDRPVCVRAIGP